jgi:hypothetical protein
MGRGNLKSIGLLLLICLLALAACHPRPVEDMALADAALKAAQKAKADALAPDAFRKAENNYLRAKRDFVDGYYDSAKRFAGQARMMAEQAEFKAVQKQSALKNGPDAAAAAGAPNGPAPSGPPGGPPGGEDLEQSVSEGK